MSSPIDRADEPLLHAIRAARGRFREDDVVGTLASLEGIDRNGVEQPGTDCWIVRLRPACGHPVGIVRATWNNYSKWKSHLVGSSVKAMPSFLSALRETRTLVGEPRSSSIMSSFHRADMDARGAIGRLLEEGVIFPQETRNTTSLIARLDDTYEPDRRCSDPDGEPFPMKEAPYLWKLHMIDPVHGVHAWGVAQRQVTPRWAIIDEMTAAGYNIEELSHGVHPLRALGLV